MKRVLLCLLTLSILLAAFVSCGGENPSSTTAAATTVPAGTTTAATTTVSAGTTTVSAVTTTAATTTTAVQTTAKEPEPIVLNDVTYQIKDHVDKLKVVGRYTTVSDGITCDWSAAGIEFTALCKGEVRIGLTSNKDTYYTVYVDGKRQPDRLEAKSGTRTLTIATVAEGEHTFRFLKQTENMYGNAVLKTLSMTGQLLDPPAEKAKYLEFIGDSITCGYGNLIMKGEAGAGTALTQDATQAYAFMTAELLKADYSLVSITGIGVDKGYRNYPMKDAYPAVSYIRNQSQKYVPTRTPNAVVINLGTNDVSNNSTESAFINNARNLINQIRTNYGDDVKIVWCYGMMGSADHEYVTKLFNELGGEEKGYYTFELATDQTGGGSHPSLAGHKTASIALATYLKSLLKK